ncbi:rho guanine nucleotide exchange factor 18 isoform X1 [Esox lucius]|nr:rho guanine nucleotide exchange factor 18 isoform X1 [Esox lucius]
MSTSRRHSLGMPLSPIDLGRRLSLDNAAIDSDGEREESCIHPSHQQTFYYPECPEQELEESHNFSSCKAKETEMEVCGQSMRTYSRSEILATDESVDVAHVSRVVETSKRAAREELDLEEPNLHTAEGQTHMLMVQKVLQELKQYHGAKQRTTRPEEKESGSSVTWYEFLSNENEEDEDRSEKVKGTKVKRTLSSLKNRMTGSFKQDKQGKNREKEQQRDKGKEKDREPKEKEILRGCSSSGHQLVTGSFSSSATCSLCSKALHKKHGLQCLNCAVNVHKSCRTLLPECNSSKNKKSSLQRTSSKASPNLALRERDRDQSFPDGPSGSPRVPGMTLTQRRPSAQPVASSSSSSLSHAAAASLSHSHNSSSGSLPGDMDETDSGKRFNDDVVSLAPSTNDAVIVEDEYYSAVQAELDSDAQDLEVESWSMAVDQQYLKNHTKEMIKRQDVIYELMQTEMHHVRTLKIMLRVYMRELKEHLQMEERQLECLFPRLESLLELHTYFLSRLKERRRDATQAGSDRNYNVQRLADILTTQFSGEIGERMKESYGNFCSHHTEAVSFYKEQLHNNKKFQNLIRKINNLPIVRRLGVTECILLVTQRITKYPVLVERIVQNTEAGTEEHEELTRSLALIKDCIVQVDALVNINEKASRLRDIAQKLEPKSLGKIKDGRVFSQRDLTEGRRKLLHEGTVNWKAASGRLKDILAVLLSDVLLLLQDKDQRYVFSAVDNKPSVISLQKLIVREVAHEEKAMFLICASSNEPEMYEIHTISKEDRNTWMTHIRQAVESCPHTERLCNEEEEARATRFKEFQERLSQKDSQIMMGLTEKLQLFADMADSVVGLEDMASRSHLLLRSDPSDLHQGETLLKGAITEVENLQNLLLSGVREPATRLEEDSGFGLLPRRADTFGGYDSSPTILSKKGNSKKKNYIGRDKGRDRSQRAHSDPQLKALEQTPANDEDDYETSPAVWNPIWSHTFPEAEFFDRVLMLSQRLYSLQAIIAQQDSHIELQRASLTERASFPGRHRGNVLLEQEKQRTLALQREELASFQKLQSQHRQEQARWEKERERSRLQAEAMEGRLRKREEECRRLEEKLAEEREELERQREMYQQDLERLRESTRTVEKEKERLEQQRKVKRKTIEVVPLSGSLNGDLLLSGGAIGPCQPELAHTLPLPQKAPVRPSLSVAPADYAERPDVPQRGQSANAAVLPVKKEVPLHLCSTTNQQHKQVGVQQQIPTKLAALSSKSTRSGKGKASHRTDSTASVDMKQMLPMKLSGREDGTLKAKRSVSPQLHLPHALVHSQSLHFTVSHPDSWPENQPSSTYLTSQQKSPSQASNPLHNPPHASNPLHNPPHASNPLHNPPHASNPLHNPPHASNTLHNPPHASNTLHNPPHASNTLHNPPHVSNPLLTQNSNASTSQFSVQGSSHRTTEDLNKEDVIFF